MGYVYYIFVGMSTTLHVDAPWGRYPGDRFIAVVNQLARAIYRVARQLGVIHLIDLVDLVALPTDLSTWSTVDLSIESIAGPNAGATLPTLLRDRQRWLAVMGSLIRQPPLHWPPALVPLFPSTKLWVDGPLRWLCPEAADLLQHEEEMRKIYRDAWRSSRQAASACRAAD